MGQVFVIKLDEEQEETATFIDTSEIVFFSLEDQKITVHTKTDKFFLPQSLEDCSLLGGFERLDRCFVAQMNQVSQVDSELNLVHFQDSSKTCYVSKHHKKRLKLK